MKTPIGLLIKKYFMHIASHGIDTHDYGILTEPMQANMVFVEPEFIFLPKDSDSSEDNIIVQESGEPFNMMRKFLSKSMKSKN
jgi:Xaa-Pro aminopeptidase